MARVNRTSLSASEAVSAAAAVVLVITLFLPWFEEKAVGRFGTAVSPLVDFQPRNRMAWATIPFIAIALVALAGVAIYNAVKRLRTGRSLRAEVLLASGALAVTVTLLGTSFHTGQHGRLGTAAVLSAGPSFGVWLALAAALAMAGGGAMGMWSKRPTGSAGPQRPNPAP